jgi:transcriptional regulator with XRE-family HTH domain
VDTQVGPAVGRRRLAAELRRLRIAAELTIQDVARELECSTGKISRVEKGLVAARIQDVREMLDLYGIRGSHREFLLDLVRQSRKKAWWHAYSDVVPPGSAQFYGLEDGASTIQEYCAVLVPGLFQTENYAAALIGAVRDAPEIPKRRIELRMQRQRLLTRDDPPLVDVVLHELVLRNTMNGRNDTVEQLMRLVELAELPHVTIRLLPMAAGPHETFGTHFTIFSFVSAEDPTVVYHEQPTRNSLFDQADEVAWYCRAFATAVELALTPECSIDFICATAKSLR